MPLVRVECGAPHVASPCMWHANARRQAGEHYWQANFYVIKNTRCPAVLTENLFQDNHEDVEFLMSAEGKAKIVELHLKCIKAYCGV